MPSLRRFTTCDVAAVGGERGEQVDRRLGVERAAALAEQRRLVSSAGSAYISSSSRSISATRAPRDCVRAPLATTASWA